MVLADRIAVIDRGRLHQVARPCEVYARPVDTFVAGFVGSPAMSFVHGEVSGREVVIKAGALPLNAPVANGPVTVGVRSHDWDSVSTAGFRGVVTSAENRGDHGFASVDLRGDQITMRVSARPPTVGEAIEVWTRRFHVFDPSGRAIAHIR